MGLPEASTTQMSRTTKGPVLVLSARNGPCGATRIVATAGAPEKLALATAWSAWAVIVKTPSMPGGTVTRAL